jgi:hypothetical protein
MTAKRPAPVPGTPAFTHAVEVASTRLHAATERVERAEDRLQRAWERQTESLAADRAVEVARAARDAARKTFNALHRAAIDAGVSILDFDD